MKKSKNSSDRRLNSASSAAWLGFWVCFGLFFLPGCLTGGSSGAVLRSPDGPAMLMAAGLYQRGESLRSLAARGGAGYTSGSARHYFKFELAALKPGRILFTALDPAGRPAFKLASDGETITCLIYGDRQYAVGPATAENFSRFLPLGLDPDQLVALMSGAQVRPVSAGARVSGESTELVVQPEGGGDDRLWRLTLAGGLEQDPAGAVIRSATFGPPRRPELSIRYLSVIQVPREDLDNRLEPFPRSVEADWTEGKDQSLRVTYDEVRLGLELPESMFSLRRPDGFELIEMN